MAPSGPRQTLLLFCKFLTHRVRTEHLDLFYTIALESLESPPCLTRVDEMLYRVFPLVAILPIDTTDESSRAKAGRVLERMRRDREGDHVMRDLGVLLSDRITLKNWDVLERIYGEFKKGSDRALRAFVALQPQAIAMIPVRPNPPTSFAPVQVSALSNQGARSASSDDEGLTSDTDKEETTERPTNVLGRGYKAMSLQLLKNVRVVLAELNAIEATAPWKRVFELSKIAYPFDESKHPKFARQLRTFWSRYARAVWQRRFWCRVPGDQAKDYWAARKTEGEHATQFFTKGVIVPLYREFGVRFFMDMDALPERIHWWWYREPVVDLVEMTRVEGVDYSLRYLRAQKLKRYPTPHPQFHMRTSLRTSPSPSMWSMHKEARHILHAIDTHKDSMKPRTQGSRTTGGKRPRTTGSSSEEDDSE